MKMEMEIRRDGEEDDEMEIREPKKD